MSEERETFRNRFLCRSCKKLLISKEALDNHIIICYESRLENMRLEHKKEIEMVTKEYEEIINFMNKHIESIEDKHIKLNNYLINQIEVLASL